MYIKPLPLFLMDHSVWTDYLCKDQKLHASASGFLLSYAWLVIHRSDFKIATDSGLLPDGITYEEWLAFTNFLLRSLDLRTLSTVNSRYLYGELRLNRLNWIYRLSPSTFSFTNFIRGYMYGYNEYSSFIRTNSAWLLVGFAYITIVVTAMQVGLATNSLQNNIGFQRASFGFTGFAILSPLAAITTWSLY